jgi:antirestriction protein ArdC
MDKAATLRESITKSFVEDMKRSNLPWRCPWNQGASGMPMNFVSRRPYSGVNALMLMGARYESPLWGSKSAWEKVGAHPRHEEKPTRIVGIGMMPSRNSRGQIKKDASGKAIWFTIVKQWEVYNILQLSGDVAKYMTNANCEPDFEPAEALIMATGAKIKHGGKKAFYCHASDSIHVPNKRAFVSMSDYYETIFHELCHWCEKTHRVGRAKDHTYAFGELVAEIGACFLSAQLRVPLAEQMLEKSRSYLAHWLEAMGGNTKYIFDAAARASKVADYLFDFTKEATNVAA